MLRAYKITDIPLSFNFFDHSESKSLVQDLFVVEHLGSLHSDAAEVFNNKIKMKGSDEYNRNIKESLDGTREALEKCGLRFKLSLSDLFPSEDQESFMIS